MGKYFQVLISLSVAITFGALTVGCATPKFAAKKNYHARKGFFERIYSSGGQGGTLSRSKSPGAGTRGEVQDSDDDDGDVAPAREVGRSVMRWPLQTVSVTSPFGKRGRDFHEGIDLRAQTGTPVYAAQAGKVLYAADGIRGYGRMIVIRHPGKVATIYAHNSKLLVHKGQRVRQGQKIAMSGNTGRSTGPHLHFEVRKGISAINPMPLLPHVEHRVATKPSRKSPRRGARTLVASK